MSSKKFLMYTSVGLNPIYNDMAQLLHDSFRRLCSHNDQVDFLIVTDRENQNAICSNQKLTNVLFHTVPKAKTGIEASMRKLEIFHAGDVLNKYENILFLDSDILVNLDIFPLISSVLDSNKLYVFFEKEASKLNLNGWFSLSEMPYTPDEIELFGKNGWGCMNAGIFLFRNSPQLKSHFQNLLNFIQAYKGQFFYEQSFMNSYFLRNGLMQNYFTEEQYLMLNYRKLNDDPNRAIIHFCNVNIPGEQKYQSMLKEWNKMLILVL